MKYQQFKYIISSALIVGALGASSSVADDDMDFKLGFNTFAKRQSDLEGLMDFSVIKRNKSGFYWGATFSMAAFGDGGGFIADGFEVGQVIPINDTYFVDGSFFIGGAIGHFQNPGLMYRPKLSIGRRFENFSVSSGLSWVKITGTDVSTPSFDISIMKPLNLASFGGHGKKEFPDFNKRLKDVSVSFVLSNYSTKNLAGRHGGNVSLDDIPLFGFEVAVSPNDKWSYFIQALSSAKRYHGSAVVPDTVYVENRLGVRRHFSLGPIKTFTDVSIGSGGRGNLDTGTGLLVNANAGVKVELSKVIYTNLGIGYVKSLTGNLSSWSPSMSLGLKLGGASDDEDKPTKKISTVYSTQWVYFPSYNNIDNPASLSPESASFLGLSMSVYLKKNLFVVFDTNTTLSKRNGFHIVRVGAGYDIALTKKLSLSPTFSLGLANTYFDLLGTAVLDLDYALNEEVSIGVGGGWVRSLSKSGKQGSILKAGFKFKFTTFH